MRWSGQWPIGTNAAAAAAAAAVAGQPLGAMVTSSPSGDLHIASMSLSSASQSLEAVSDGGAGCNAGSDDDQMAVGSSASSSSSAMLAAAAAAAVAQRGGGAAGGSDATAQLTLATNPTGTLMTIDHQLHQQIQQHLSAEQLDLLNQLQV